MAEPSQRPPAPWADQAPRRWDLGSAGSVDELRRTTADEAAAWVSHRQYPPLGRLVVVTSHLALAVGAWAVVERGTPGSRSGLSDRLRHAFARLGPTYIKLGQILSSGEGLFPDELVASFALLRDRVPPEPFHLVRRTIEEDLGAPLADRFVSFDHRPLASASIAQVHAAALRDGTPVVVKVQRRQVASQVRRDLNVLCWLAPALVGRIPVAALANPPALVELFAETISEELDFRLEAQNMLDIAAVLARTGQRAIVVPRPHAELVTRRVLVMERLSGFSWSDVEAMRAAGIDTAAVLRSALIALLEGALLEGVFHGDLHGGNLFVQRDGRVALLDFGITGRLDERQRVAFLRLQAGATANDLEAQVTAMRDLGALPADSDIPTVIAELGLDRPAIDPTALTAEELLGELRAITAALLGIGARLPKPLMLFVKDLLFLNGSMATMAPDVDLLGEVVAVVEHFTRNHGERIARDIGQQLATAPTDLAGYRAALGLVEGEDSLTFRELQERRELIRRRLAARRRRTGAAGAVAGEPPRFARLLGGRRRRSSGVVEGASDLGDEGGRPFGARSLQ